MTSETLNSAISDTTDGPVTAYVMLIRACNLAASGMWDPQVVADALCEELTTYGYLGNEDFDQDEDSSDLDPSHNR